MNELGLCTLVALVHTMISFWNFCIKKYRYFIWGAVFASYPPCHVIIISNLLVSCTISYPYPYSCFLTFATCFYLFIYYYYYLLFLFKNLDTNIEFSIKGGKINNIVRTHSIYDTAPMSFIWFKLKKNNNNKEL